MFSITGIDGRLTPYTPGAIRQGRWVEEIQPIRPVQKTGKQKPHQEEGRNSEEIEQKVTARYHQPTPERPKPEAAVLARQIMTSSVISLPPTAELTEAAELFQSRRFRHIPVISKEEKLIGLISDRDLWRELAKARVPLPHRGPRALTGNLQEIMTTRVLVAHPDSEIRAIARVLFEERIGAMPLVEDSGKLVGILTRSDILRTVVHQVPFELWV